MKKFWKNHKKEEIVVSEGGQDGLELVSLEDGPSVPAPGRKRKKKEKTLLTPAQKKKKRKRIITGAVAACLVLYIVSRMFAPAPIPIVTVRSAQVGTIEQTVDTSGTVQTEVKKTYFSPLSAKVGEFQVEVGDTVTAGDILLFYDAEDLEERRQEASLQNDEAYYNYQDTVNKSASEAAEYSRSSHDVEILEQQVADWKATVSALRQYITDLGCHLRDAQKDGHENRSAELQSMIDQANNDLTDKQEELAEFESDLAEQKAIQSASEDAVLTDSARKQATATKDLAEMKADKVESAVEEVKDGLKAEFGGVVTDIKAVEGGVTEENGELLTVESNEDVCVMISLNKSDLEKVKEGQKAVVTVVGKEYEGTVTRVSKSATKNDKGASVVEGEIHIDNPDEDIFLGVDAKVKIEGVKAENVVTVPIEAVNVGKEGSFVYVVEDGILGIRDVETGISSAEAVEIVSGLDGTEQVVLSVGTGLEEGSPVMAVEG